MSTYDIVAPTYDEFRALSDAVLERIRRAVVDAMPLPSRPRLLDLGAGSGRVGRAFVAAGDDYVGVDLSLGMLRQFARRDDTNDRRPRLVQADGERLPFGDALFDGVLLVQDRDDDGELRVRLHLQHTNPTSLESPEVEPGDPVLLRSIFRGRVRWTFPHRYAGEANGRVALYCAPGNRGKVLVPGGPHDVEAWVRGDAPSDHAWEPLALPADWDAV